MNKRILVLVVLMITAWSYANAAEQCDPVDRYMWRTGWKKDCRMIYVPGIVKWFFVNKIDDDAAKSLVKGCRGIKVMAYEPESDNTVDLEKHAQKIYKKLKKSNYTPLIEVLDKGTKVVVSVKKHKRKKNVLKGLTVMAFEGEELVLVKLKGRFNLNELNVSELMNDVPKALNQK